MPTPKTPARSPRTKSQESPQEQAHQKLRELLPTLDAEKPSFHFLAGPNGAGKSTLYETHLKHFGLPFINADIVHKELLGLMPGTPKPDVLAQSMAEMMRGHFLAHKASFITETVFSDEQGAKLQFLKEIQSSGYFATMHYVCIESPQDSMERVDQRVKNGGHTVPREKLVRRYNQSLANAKEALKFVHLSIVYENMNDLEPDPNHPDALPHQIMAIVVSGKVQWVHPNIPPYISALLPIEDAASTPAKRGTSARKK